MTTFFGRSRTYGLDSGPDETDWRRQGACNNYDPDLWGSLSMDERGQAIWVCQRECPVRANCYRWADEHRELVDQMVYGGVYWSKGSNEAGVSRSRLPRPALQQPTPVRPTGTPAQPPRQKHLQPHVALLPHLDGIRALAALGWSNSDIGHFYGCTDDSIRDFRHRNGITWTGRGEPG